MEARFAPRLYGTFIGHSGSVSSIKIHPTNPDLFATSCIFSYKA